MKYGNKTALIALNDSLLQCLNPKSLKEEDIVVYQVKKILEQQGMKNVLPIDCGSLFLNKQHNITEFLKNNLSLAEIKATQIESIDAARHGIAKYFLNEKIKGYYPIQQEDHDVRISDVIKESENVGVLLSCIANDMMSSVHANPIGYLIAKLPFMDKSVLKRTRILLEDKSIINGIVDGLKVNMEQILGINDKAKICTVGIYRPQILPKDFEEIFNSVNEKVESATKEYQQNYIDINDIKSKPIDFHPDLSGYKVISERIAKELMRRFYNDQNLQGLSIPNFEYQTLGLDGAIEDIRKYYESDKVEVKAFIRHLINTYNYNVDEISEIMKAVIIGRQREAKEMESLYSNAKKLIK